MFFDPSTKERGSLDPSYRVTVVGCTHGAGQGLALFMGGVSGKAGVKGNKGRNRWAALF